MFSIPFTVKFPFAADSYWSFIAMRHVDSPMTLFVCCFVFPLEIVLRIPITFSITYKEENTAIMAGSQLRVDVLYPLWE